MYFLGYELSLSTKFKVIYQGYNFHKMAFEGGICVSQTHLALNYLFCRNPFLLGYSDLPYSSTLYHTMSLLKHYGKRKKVAGNQHFLLFQHFLTHQRNISQFEFYKNCQCKICFGLDQSSADVLSLSQTRPGLCSTNILKTLKEKEKLLIRSNFSFSHSVFYLFELSSIFIKCEIVMCKLFHFGRV